MTVVERRAIQQRQRADDVDRALDRERVALANATARIRALEQTIASSGPVRDTIAGPDTTARVADFTVRQAPYTVTAKAVVPAPPQIGSLRVGITLDPLDLQLRLGCGPAGPDGARPATTALIGPDWAALRLGPVQQSADVCKSPALEPKAPSRLRWAAIGAGVALVLAELTRILTAFR